MILKGEVLEIRNVEGRLHIARKTRHHDEWDALIRGYDPYCPGQPIMDVEDFEDVGGDVDAPR